MKIKRLYIGAIVVLMILSILFISSYLMYRIDCNRLYNNKKPILAIHIDELNDGGTKNYYGILYQIIDWQPIDGSEKIETHFIFNYNFQGRYREEE